MPWHDMTANWSVLADSGRGAWTSRAPTWPTAHCGARGLGCGWRKWLWSPPPSSGFCSFLLQLSSLSARMLCLTTAHTQPTVDGWEAHRPQAAYSRCSISGKAGTRWVPTGYKGVSLRYSSKAVNPKSWHFLQISTAALCFCIFISVEWYST